MLKKSLFFAFIFVVAISCENSKRMASTLFENLEEADSLLLENRTDSALQLINNILDYKLTLERFSFPQKIWYLVTSDLVAEEASLYFDYFFAYCAQLEAIDLKKCTTNDAKEQLDIDKCLFDLAPDLYEVSQNYVQFILANGNNNWRIASSFYDYRHLYDNYLHSNSKFITLFDKDGLVSYVYREKWNRMSRVLMISDVLYGYDETYHYFDTVLQTNGTSVEPYTKSLIKSYMSFSANPKYEFQTSMSYENFRRICENKGDWLISKIQKSLISLVNEKLST